MAGPTRHLQAPRVLIQEAVDEQVERLARLEQQLLELAPKWRMYPVVEALQALRGVQWLVALTVVAELGDLTRFDNPRQLAAFVGLTERVNDFETPTGLHLLSDLTEFRC